MDIYPNSLIPVEQLIRFREIVANKKDLQSPNYPLPLGITSESSDKRYRFYKKNKYREEEEPIFSYSGSGVEFCSVTVLSPEWIESTNQRHETLKKRNETAQRLKEKIERSKCRTLSGAKALGNIGNNLDGFEKPVREKRYRIQSFIKKNNLLPGKWEAREMVNQETGEIYEGEYYQKSRVCLCGCPLSDFVDVKRNKEHGNINISGVATCGSVWACPVCRSKIVNERAKELNSIYQNGTKKGYKYTLLTLTIPHEFKDNLAELYGSSNLRKGLSGALTRLRQSRTWSKRLKKEIDYVGDVRSIEITYGLTNGFHPHIHMVLIHKNKFPEHLKSKLLEEWQKSALKSGLQKPNERGLKIDAVNSSEMVTYLSKWSVGSELQSDSVKEAKGKNYSIAQLELMLVDDKVRGLNALSLDRISGILKSYYIATKGQKQLVYGGLNNNWKKELLENEEEKTDSEIAESETEKEEITESLFILTSDSYKKLVELNEFSNFMESLEALERNIPGYDKMIIKRAEQVFHLLGIPGKNIFSHSRFNEKFNKKRTVKDSTGQTILTTNTIQ